MTIGGSIAFPFSVVFLVGSSVRVASVFSDNWADMYWISIAIGYLQITLIALTLSVVNQLHWLPFIVSQTILASIAFYFIRTTDHEIHDLSRIRLTFNRFNIYERILTISLLLTVISSLLIRILSPEFATDSLSYHLPRVLFWLQQSHIGLYPTRVPRQIGLAFGSSFIFMWPVMFVRSEIIGRLVYWIGYPLAIVGMYFLLDNFQYKREVKLFGVLLLATTPIIFLFSSRMEPLIFVVLFSIGVGYWTTTSTDKNFGRLAAFLGMFTVISAGLKEIAIPLIGAGLFVTWVWETESDSFGAEYVYLISVMSTGVVTGFFLKFIWNLEMYGTLLFPAPITDGSSTIRTFSLADSVGLGIQAFLLLIEFPIPIVELNIWLRKAINSLFIFHVFPTEVQLVNECVSYFQVSSHQLCTKMTRSFYRFTPPIFPRRSYGLTGLLIVWYLLRRVWRGVISVRHISLTDILSYSLEVNISSPLFLYLLVTLVMFVPQIYLLSATNQLVSHLSFLAPGVILGIPFVLAPFSNTNR